MLAASGQSPLTGTTPWLSHMPIDGPAAWPVAHRMHVASVPEPFAQRGALCPREDVVAGPAGHELGGEQVLPAIARRQGAHQAFGHVGLSSPGT